MLGGVVKGRRGMKVKGIPLFWKNICRLLLQGMGRREGVSWEGHSDKC